MKGAWSVGGYFQFAMVTCCYSIIVYVEPPSLSELAVVRI